MHSSALPCRSDIAPANHAPNRIYDMRRLRQIRYGKVLRTVIDNQHQIAVDEHERGRIMDNHDEDASVRSLRMAITGSPESSATSHAYVRRPSAARRENALFRSGPSAAPAALRRSPAAGPSAHSSVGRMEPVPLGPPSLCSVRAAPTACAIAWPRPAGARGRRAWNQAESITLRALAAQ